MNNHSEKKSLDFFQNKWGYAILPSEGLLNPSFPDTFTASAFHGSVGRAVRNGSDENNHQVGTEWCFRHVDIEKVGISPIYLSVFRMFVFFDVFVPTDNDDDLRQSVIDKFVAYIKYFGLDPHNLSVTYFGGGKIKNIVFPEDSRIVAWWNEQGVTNLVPIKGQQNFTNVRRLGEPSGPRCEVFYHHPGFSQPIEIGTVVFEKYVLGKTLDKAKGFVYGGALGMERLAMLQENKKSIFESSLLDDKVEIVTKELEPKLLPMIQADVLRLVDALRSLSVILAAVDQGSMTKRQQERVNKITNIARQSFQAIGILEKEQITRIVRSILDRLQLYELEYVQSKNKLSGLIIDFLT